MSLIEETEFDDSEPITTYDNYIYNVLIKRYEIVIDNPDQVLEIENIYQRCLVDVRIMHAFENQNEAEESLTHLSSEPSNFSQDFIDTLKRIFGTHITFTSIDPETYQYVLVIDKYEIIKTELRGYVLHDN